MATKPKSEKDLWRYSPKTYQLKRGDWLALGMGMVAMPLLQGAFWAVHRYGLSVYALHWLIWRLSNLEPVLVVFAGLSWLIYFPVTVIALYNVRFRPLLKYPFCLFICPAFIVLMVINIAWSNEHLAVLTSLASSGVRAGALVGALVALPLAALVCLVWYLVFATLDRVLPGRPIEPKGNGPAR